MRMINDVELANLDVPERQYVEWVREAFLAKPASLLPKKTSITFNSGKNFVNTMPCIIPSEGVFGVKVVSRYPGRKPTIQGHILIYNLETGEEIAVLEAAHITEQRTGAVAALAAETLSTGDSEVVSVMGLGVTGLAFLRMYASSSANKGKQYRLLRYKNQADHATELLQSLGADNVSVVDTPDTLVSGADIVVSAITVAESQIASPELFKPGVTLIPIHTRGFQECDTLFDKVFADDRGHVQGFERFADFREFGEISDVLQRTRAGRTSPTERIISYNIGIALHDVLIGSRLTAMVTSTAG